MLGAHHKEKGFQPFFFFFLWRKPADFNEGLEFDGAAGPGKVDYAAREEWGT